MRRTLLLLCLALSLPAFGQRTRPIQPRNSFFAQNAENAIKQAAEEFGAAKVVFQRDMDVLAHVRLADAALVDPMQPSVAVQKALDELNAAKLQEDDTRTGPPEFTVSQGILKVIRELQNANLSPSTADFGHLRALLAENASGPATRVVARDGAALQEQVTAWLHVQQLITDHLHDVSELSSQALRASQQ